MKLDEVLVQNYRTLENVKVTFSGYYTAISGQNNAGKTTLMKVIRNVFRITPGSIFISGDEI